MAEGTIPQGLQPGDTIAFVSPSGRLNNIFPARIARAKTYLESQGYHVKEIYNPLSEDFLESVKQRCEELHAAFGDAKVKAIVCTIGGLSANELLPHLDYDLIRANPKIFCGYSDITLLHNAFFLHAGLRTFYGPAIITQFGEAPEPMEFVTTNFFDTLLSSKGRSTETHVPRSLHWTKEHLDWGSEESNTRARRTDASPPWKWLRSGMARGRLMGGCLPSLVQLCGTNYLPDYTGRILLLETPEGMKEGTPFPPDFARSSMADLRLSGILGSVAGIVVGRPYMYDEEMTAEFEKIVVAQCYGTDFPILANVDVGHTDPILTLPLGAMVSLSSEENRFAIEEATVM
ncbi:hypothetical protein MBLNU459_g8445t1 [Dothideomycetes sp. NU459]